MRNDVSVLYVDPRGPYPKLVADWWDEKRDARLYAGPNPVVAHPPCGPWSSLRHLWTKHQKEVGPFAVEQVRRWGGVLEHPAYSLLFEACRMPKPGEFSDEHGGCSYEVQQCDWGHPARKRTWIYVVGLAPLDPDVSVSSRAHPLVLWRRHGPRQDPAGHQGLLRPAAPPHPHRLRRVAHRAGRAG